MDENENLVISDNNNKNEIIVSGKKKKNKKIFIICLIIFLLFGILVLIFKSNLIYKAFPKTYLPLVSSKTYKIAEKETNNVKELYNLKIRNSNVSNGNQFDFSIANLELDVQHLNNMAKIYADFNSKVKMNFYLDKSELIFNINNSEYFKVDLYKTHDSYQNEATNTTKIESKSTNTQLASSNAFEEAVFQSAPNNKTNASSGNFNIHDYNSIIKKLLEVENVVTFYDDRNEIKLNYTVDEFKALMANVVEPIDAALADSIAKSFAEIFTSGSDTVTLTLIADNSGKFKNVIRSIRFETDSRRQSFVQFDSVGDDKLLSDIKLSYKIIKNENEIMFNTDINKENDYFLFTINQNEFKITFQDDTNEIELLANGKQFLRISDNFTEIQKPISYKSFSDATIFDILGIDTTPIENFFNTVKAILSI